MNICLVLISDGWGGAETVVYELARHLRDKEENVSIILNQEILRFYDDLKGVEVFNIGCVYHPMKLTKSIIFPSIDKKSSILNSFPWYYLNELLRLVYFKRIRKKILNFLLDKEVDIIHSHLEKSDMLVFCLSNLEIPWITTIHGKYSLKEDSPIRFACVRKKLKQMLFKSALNRVDKITGVSEFILNEYENLGISLSNKSIVIPNGIALSEFQRNSIPTLKLKGQFNLIFPGGAKLGKGINLLIEALHKVKNEILNTNLYITRKVPNKCSLREMVKDLGLERNVIFTGFLSLQEYRSLLNSIDLLVMPSKEEPFGIVFLEAAALGKPIIAANKGGALEFIVNGRNGILVERNSKEIADSILYLYKNEKIRKDMSQNNRKDVKKFDWSSIIDEYIDIYQKTLVEKRG